MKFCSNHWSKLRKAIEDRGLGPFIAHGGEEAMRRMVGELEQGSERSNFEPLMGAHNAILGNAMQAAGLAIMQPNEDGSDRCPLCFLASHDPRFEEWIDRAADDALTEAKRLGLVGGA